MKRILLRGALATTATVLALSASAGALLAEETDVAIDETNFPDEMFRSYVASVIDKDHDGVLQSSEANAVHTIELTEKHLKTVEGIRFFPNLSTLNVTANNIMSLDLSNNPKLENVYCMANNMSTIDVTMCPELTSLVCSENALIKLDLTHNPKLHDVACNDNEIKELDLSKNPELAEIDCSSNRLKKLDLSNNPKMTGLLCADNKLTELDLSGAPEMTSLYASSNPLGTLDVSKNPKLDMLVVEACELKSLDVSKNPELTLLACTANEIAELDLKNNTMLTALRCEENKLSSLDLSENTKIDLLFVSDNELKELDLSALPELDALDCKGNQLTSLDLSNNTNLRELVCSENKLAELDLKYTQGLVLLECEHNDFKELNISFTPNIIFVYFNAEPEKKGDILIYHYEAETFEYEFVVSADVTMITDDQPGDPGEDPTDPDPEDHTFGAFIERLYEIALGRDSEEAGKKYWMDEIQSGRKNGADCARFFLTGEEFVNRKLSDEQLVDTLYLTFFDRDGEENGKQYWLGRLKAGASHNEIIDGFIDSTEWCNVCARYAVKSGAPTAKAEIPSAPASNFVAALYLNCLNREAEEEGLYFWGLALTNLEQTGCSTAKHFFTSEEFRNLNLTDDDYVTRLYKTFMGREPEASEVAYWTGEIGKGAQTRDSVIAFFGQSEEFTNICNKYGIERGTM